MHDGLITAGGFALTAILMLGWLRMNRKIEKSILTPEQVTQVVTDRLTYGPTCSRCFGGKEDPDELFCRKCRRSAEEKADAESMASILKQAKTLSLEFPWIMDPATGLARLLREDEICVECQKAQVLATGIARCGPCEQNRITQAQLQLEQIRQGQQRQQQAALGLFAAQANKTAANAIAIYTGGSPVVTIQADGGIQYAPGVTPSQAAREFWAAVASEAKTKTAKVPETVNEPGDRQIDFRD